MSSEYEPAFGGEESGAAADLDAARSLFATASRPYLASPVPWALWALLLPGAALATSRVARLAGPAGVLGLWSVVIVLGGSVEAGFLWRNRRRYGASRLGGWAMTVQGNLSLVAVTLSAVCLALGQPRLLPGLWLLLLGHSLFALGGLAFAPQRVAGVVYQLGGALALVGALVPGVVPELAVFAAASFLGNAWIALGVHRARRPAPD